MDRRDWELLDRQMSRLQLTPQAHGLNAIVLVGLFLACLAYVYTPPMAPSVAIDGAGRHHQPAYAS